MIQKEGSENREQLLSSNEMLDVVVGEIGNEAIKRRELQLQGLRNAFRTVFEEYVAKWEEIPDLKTDGDVQKFILARSDFWRTIQGLDAVQGEVNQVAFKVLEEMRARQAEEQMGGLKAA